MGEVGDVGDAGADQQPKPQTQPETSKTEPHQQPTAESRKAAPNRPLVAKTERRANFAWWFLFCSPVFLAGCVGIAGAIGGAPAAIGTFTVGVWALTFTLGVAAAPRWDDKKWWLQAVAGSTLAAAAGLGLLFGVSKVGVAVREDIATTTTTSTTAPASSTSTSSTSSSVP